jgi:Fe2+ or Zn2+ uptake regulation protein
MIEFQSPELDAAMQAICRQHHFTSAGHTLLVRGVCADCNRARVPKRMLDLV